MSKVRILIVDDMPIFRRIVTELFERELEFEVVGLADNGREALTRIHLLNPDLVILDLEMPVMNGWETLQAIKLSYPKLAVIVFTSLPADAGDIVAHARALGARDLVPKPANMASRDAAWRHLEENLLAKVRQHFREAGPRDPEQDSVRRST